MLTLSAGGLIRPCLTLDIGMRFVDTKTSVFHRSAAAGWEEERRETNVPILKHILVWICMVAR